MHSRCLLLLVLFVLGGCSPPLKELGQVPEFSLTDQDGRTVTRGDLAGKVWVASFIFTRCGGPCPQVTASMAKLQGQVADQTDVRLVTVTVDPEHDTPEILKRYAAGHQANPERWLFLTGPKEQVYSLITTGFQFAVQPVAVAAGASGDKIIHSTKLVLVDRRGHIRNRHYDGRQHDEAGAPVDEVAQLKQDILTLLKEKP